MCRFFALKHGNVMFHEGGTIGKRVTWSSNDDHLRRWKEGQTGLPLVDANMRELAQTGGAAACRGPAVTVPAEVPGKGARARTQLLGLAACSVQKARLQLPWSLCLLFTRWNPGCSTVASSQAGLQWRGCVCRSAPITTAGVSLHRCHAAMQSPLTRGMAVQGSCPIAAGRTWPASWCWTSTWTGG